MLRQNKMALQNTFRQCIRDHRLFAYLPVSSRKNIHDIPSYSKQIKQEPSMYFM